MQGWSGHGIASAVRFGNNRSMQKQLVAKNWLDYFEGRAKHFENPLDISGHYFGEGLVDRAFMEREQERLLSLLQPDKSQDIYDLGCGVGVSLRLVYKAFRRGIGVDFGAVNLRKAKKLLPDCSFVLDDISCLSKFPDQSMQYVLSYLVLHNMGPVSAVRNLFRALKRVCKPGAKVVLSRIPDKKYYEEYQKFRRSKKFVRDQRVATHPSLKWIWLDEKFIRQQAGDAFHLTIVRQSPIVPMPLKAWFDCVLIKK
jgi:SAM-dependent methyltransferase